MPRLQPNILVLTGLVVAAVVCWFLWRPKKAPQLLAAPISVSYDQEATRLTAVVNLLNSSDHPIVASITNNVLVDSQKQPFTDGQVPRRIELGSKQSNPVTFTVQGESAADAWNGARLLEVTIDASYDSELQSAKLNCHFSFMGRFYPQLKQFGVVSNVISPRECRGD
jgi:hypothetical protein